MSTEPTTEPAGERSDEVAELRERVAALERELADRAARANDALASAQDRTYWLDRWHVDPNALMRRPLLVRLWRLMPLARGAYRGVRNARGALAKARLERRLGGAPDEASERRRRLDLSGLSEAEAGERFGALERVVQPGDLLALTLRGDELSPRWVLERAARGWEIVDFGAGAGAASDEYVLRRV